MSSTNFPVELCDKITVSSRNQFSFVVFSLDLARYISGRATQDI